MGEEENQKEVKLVNGKEEEEAKEMSPWEQHSAVITIPRFDYNAPSSLFQHSHIGFLITCPIKREKSATKEAISVLAKHFESLSGCSAGECFDPSDANPASKKWKTCFQEGNTENGNGAKNDGIVSEETSSSTHKMEANVEKGLLSLVKLNRSGLLLLIFPRNNLTNITDIVSNIYQSVNAGNLKPLNWCHRIFPVQATCKLNEEELCPVVSKLLQQFLDNEQNKYERPIKFAVGFNRRGMDEKERKTRESNSKDLTSLALLNRNKCFGLVASVVKDTITDSIVDLKSPQFAVLIEVLPLSGIPSGSLVVAVSILPHNLLITKPKLSIKALNSDTKINTGRN